MPGPHVMVLDDDPLLLRAVRRAVRRTRPDWTLAVVTSPADALHALDARRADVVVSDLALAKGDGGAVLAEIARRWPSTLRVLFTADPVPRRMNELTGVAHRIVPRGPNPLALLARIDDALTARAWLDSEELQRVVCGARELPRAPEITPRLDRLARDDRATVKDVAEVVSRDPAVAARVLRIASSVYFGAARRLKTLDEAVARLGMRNIRALVLDTEIVHRFAIPPQSGLSADQLARHSFHVAHVGLQIAREVAPKLAETVFLAGVVHDVGKLVLADRDPERLARDLELAARSNASLHEIEAQRHGVTHATVGAALLHLWSFDERVVEGVAEHHRPPSRRPGGLDAATILWVAQAAVREPEDVTPEIVQEVAALQWGARFAEWAQVTSSIA